MIPINNLRASHREARKIIRNILGKLAKDEVVHHIDENPLNNGLNNLIVMDNAEHVKYHQFKRRLKKLTDELNFSKEQALKYLHRQDGFNLIKKHKYRVNKLIKQANYTEKEAKEIIIIQDKIKTFR